MPGLSLLAYRTGLWLYRQGIALSAAIGNTKARDWEQGREGLIAEMATRLKNKPQSIWFHCASLGEFEQGRPLIERIRRECPGAFIILTFFSPSGYHQKKNYAEADEVFYLPLDSQAHAQAVIEAIKPKAAFFIKYEFWYFYFKELHQKGIPLFLVSSVFTSSQPFFRFYGSVHRQMLSYVTTFFVQDQASVHLLNELGYKNVILISDTRVDRVYELSHLPTSIPSVEAFLQGEKAFIGGSVYKTENKLIHQAWQNGLIRGKIILAPHTINKQNIQAILSEWQGEAVLYTSFLAEGMKTTKDVLILNTVGMLSALYRYGTMAFIGGGFNHGLHNTLEPAAWGLPVIIGPAHQSFPEATAMMQHGGAFEVKKRQDFEKALQKLSDPDEYSGAIEANERYIRENTGGTEKVWQHVKEALLCS